MAKPLPPLPPEQQQRVEKFHDQCSTILDRYVHGVEMDMNRHAVKHGPMPRDRAHYDVTMLLMKDLDAANLAGLLSEAILRGIAKKREGKG